VKRRGRTAQTRVKRDIGVSDGPTAEWRQHHDAVVEDRDVKGTKGIRALSQNAFDRYYRRTELATDKKENMRLYMAGERLRGDWERAGLDTRARQSFERQSAGSVEEFSAARVDAWKRVRQAMVVLGPTRHVVVNAAVYGERVGRSKMEMLRAGLSDLGDMYFGRGRA
jgi:hypothetical protein